MSFPQNPTHGLIAEVRPGEFYIYNSGTKSWVRIDGHKFELATPLKPGLMASADLRKLNSLILPPPQSSLKGEDCSLVFNSGTVTLFSSDKSLTISPDRDIQTGYGGVEQKPWQIHENTAGYDFRLNLELLVKEIEERGSLTKIQLAGPEGARGDPGEDGTDKLNTGPKGVEGEDGSNSPFGGSLATETFTLSPTDENRNRAIISIENKEGEEDVLVVTRANIGDPDACPDRISPSDFDSPWILVLDQRTGRINRMVEETDDCALTCRICVSSIYYLNIETIIEAVLDRYRLRLAEIKFSKENIVRAWLRVMSSVYNEQKYALCCALEACETRKRNTSERRYIEQQRVLAATGNLSLVVGSGDDKNPDRVETESDESCIFEDELGSNTGRVIYGEECGQHAVRMILDARIHNRDPRTGFKSRHLEARLPAGDYMVEVLDGAYNVEIPKPKPKPRPVVQPQPPQIPQPPVPTQTHQPQVSMPPRQNVIGQGPPIYLGDLYHDPAWGGDGRIEALYKPGLPILGPPTPGTGIYASGSQPQQQTPAGGGGVATRAPGFSPGGAVPPGLRIPWSNTPQGPKTIFELKCDDLQLSGQLGIQPGDTIGTKTLNPFRTSDLTQAYIRSGLIDSNTARKAGLSLNSQQHMINKVGVVGNDCRAITSRQTRTPPQTGGGWGGGATGPYARIGLPADGDLIPGCIPSNLCADSTADGGTGAKGKWAGRAVIIHDGYVPGAGTVNSGVVDADQVTELPDLGFFDTKEEAQSAYNGLNTLFTHAGGLVKVFIPDPDKLRGNNEGSLMIGFRSRKCLEMDEEDPTEVTAAPIPKIYVYRDKVSSDTLIGEFEPFIAEGQTLSSNYGLSGSNANLKAGPTLEKEVSKAFFVLADDGMGFYHIHNKANGALETTILTTYIVEDNNASAPTSVLVSDGDGEVEAVLADSGKEIFKGEWSIENDTDGVVLGPFDTLDDEWTLTLDDMNFGNIVSLEVVDGSDTDRDPLILAKGVSGSPVPPQADGETDAFVLCRALRRVCNVPDGFGGRHSLAIVNRVKGKNFRICRILPDWIVPPRFAAPGGAVPPNLRPVGATDDGDPGRTGAGNVKTSESIRDHSWIRKPYTYSPEGNPCGTTACNVRYEVVAGSEGEIRNLQLAEGGTELPPQIDGNSADFIFLVHARSSLEGALDNLADAVNGIQQYMVDGGVEYVRMGVVRYGAGPDLDAYGAAESQIELVQPLTYDTVLIENALRSIVLHDEVTNPGLAAIKWTTTNVNWFSGAVKIVTLISDVDSNGNGNLLPEPNVPEYIDTDEVDEALKAVGINFNAVVDLTYGDTQMHYGKPYDIDRPLRRVFHMGSGAGGTGLAYENQGAIFRIQELIGADVLTTVLTGRIDCDSWSYALASCRIPAAHKNPRNFRVVSRRSRSTCEQGVDSGAARDLRGHWWYDANTRTLYSADGCRATFEYDYDGVSTIIEDPNDTDFSPQAQDAPSFRFQPFQRFRLHVPTQMEIQLSAEGRSRVSTPPTSTLFRDFDFYKLGIQNNYHHIVGRVFDASVTSNINPGDTVRGALVHVKIPELYGEKVISSGFTDQGGQFAVPIPVEALPQRQVTAVVDVHIYAQIPKGDWIIDNPTADSGFVQGLEISQQTQPTIRYTEGDTVTDHIAQISANPGGLVGIRGLHSPTGGSPANISNACRVSNVRSDVVGLSRVFAFDLEFDDGPRIAYQGSGSDFDYNDLKVRVYNTDCSCLPTSTGTSGADRHAVTSSQRQVRGPAPDYIYGTETTTTYSDGSVETRVIWDNGTMTSSISGIAGDGPVGGSIPIEPIATYSRKAVIPDLSRTFGPVPGTGAGVGGLGQGAAYTNLARGGGVVNLDRGDIVIPRDEAYDIEQEVSICGGGFFSLYKAEKLREIRQKTISLEMDCSTPVNGGPSPVYRTVQGVAMTEEVLDGTVVGIHATMQALPGTAIKAHVYDRQGRGIVTRPIDTPSAGAAWRTNTWLLSDEDYYFDPWAESEEARQELLKGNYRNDPRIQTAAGRVELLTKGMSIKLRDLLGIGFEWINPDTGIISYIAQVQVSVELNTDQSDDPQFQASRRLMFVDISNFEPWGTSIEDDGDIPLAIFTPQEVVTDPGIPGSPAGATLVLPPTGNELTHNKAVQIGKMGEIIFFVNEIDGPNTTGTQVLIGANDSETLDNLKAFINDTGTNGVQYKDQYQENGFAPAFSEDFGDTIALAKTDNTLHVAARSDGVNSNEYIAHIRIGEDTWAFGEGVMECPGCGTPGGVISTMTGGSDPIEGSPSRILLPTEVDYSAYLENFWTISGPNDHICVRLRDFCTDCEVNDLTEAVNSFGCRRVEINCVEKTRDIRVPLSKYIFTLQCPSSGCSMHHSKVEWYERGWRTSACCGAFVEVDGVQWIVVKRSVGTDPSCGGGEKSDEACIKQFVDAGLGHPAIAWPSIDGEEFIGRPTSGFVRMISDDSLSDDILEAIRNGHARAFRGELTQFNVHDKIPFIIFPKSI